MSTVMINRCVVIWYNTVQYDPSRCYNFGPTDSVTSASIPCHRVCSCSHPGSCRP